MSGPRRSDRPQRRADARRNIESILDAARRRLSEDPDASVGDIAAAAGVGRVTLYGHFPSRAELVEAVATRNLEAFDTALEAIDLTGDPHDALVRLVDAIWQLTAESALLVVAAERSLPPDRLLAAHDKPLRRVAEFVEHGQAQGAFRADLPASWLFAMFHSTVHAAATEIAAGRLDAPDAGHVIATTLLAAFQRPTQTAPTSNGS
jgi:TetR/AcrR family transcriptional regulator, mexCD-oprJ operon repressor